MPRCSQPIFCPSQCVAPAIQRSGAELAKRRAAASSSFGCEGLRFDRITSLGEGLGCAGTRQQRVRINREWNASSSPSLLQAGPLDCDDAKLVDRFCLSSPVLFQGSALQLTPGSWARTMSRT